MDWLAVLKEISPRGKTSILQAISQLMPVVSERYSINTDLRAAHFLAQLAHESAGFTTTVEYASGKAYEGRSNLGNINKGDGVKFKGRGLIQLTGRANYARASKDLKVNFVDNPELAGQFPHALMTAGWFWSVNKINRVADKDDLVGATKIINGGTNGLDDRRKYLLRAKSAIEKQHGIAPPVARQKSMATSKTGNASIVAGAGSALATGKVAIDIAKDAKETAYSAADLAMSVGPWVLLGVVIVGLAVFIWYDRRQKMKVFGI